MIVASIDVALASMIFAPPGCCIIALVGKHERGNYFYYSKLAGVLGCRLFYVLGELAGEGSRPIHPDYIININGVHGTLINVCKP